MSWTQKLTQCVQASLTEICAKIDWYVEFTEKEELRPVILQESNNYIPERFSIWRLCIITLISLNSVGKYRFWPNRDVRYLTIYLFKRTFFTETKF